MDIKRAVTDIINKWDPIGLMMHAPEDEYEVEINAICEALSTENINVEEFAKVIQNVFIKEFGHIFNRGYNECLDVAVKIINSI